MAAAKAKAAKVKEAAKAKAANAKAKAEAKVAKAKAKAAKKAAPKPAAKKKKDAAMEALQSAGVDPIFIKAFKDVKDLKSEAKTVKKDWNQAQTKADKIQKEYEKHIDFVDLLY